MHRFQRGLHLAHILPSSDWWILVLEPLHQTASIRLGKEADAVAGLVGLVHTGHPHPVEVGDQDVVGPTLQDLKGRGFVFLGACLS